MNKDDILDVLKDNTEHLRETYGVTRIGLFGSFGRDLGGESSDIDLLVDLNKAIKTSLTIYASKTIWKTCLSEKWTWLQKKHLKTGYETK